MKSCERYELLASLVLDGEASEAERSELTAHLETCPDCRAYLEDIRRIHAACAREEISVPEGFAVRVMDRVRETEQDRPQSKKMEKKVIQFTHWKRWTALAACCVVAVLSLWAVRDAGGVKGDIATVGDTPQMSTDMIIAPQNAADHDGPAPLFDDDAAAEDDVTLDEAPLEIPEEYQDLAKSAARDGEGEGQYAPLVNDTTAATQEPAIAAAAPPVYDRDTEAEDALPAPEEAELDRQEPENVGTDEAEPVSGSDPEGADAPEEPEAVAPEETEEPEESVEALEPVEVIGVPEPGILTAYGSAAQRWVEDVLGAEWASGGSYPLTAEQYADLLRTLDEAGEFYSITPGEGYCLMTE